MPASHFYQPLIKTQRKPDTPPGAVFNTNLNIDPVDTPGYRPAYLQKTNLRLA